MGDYRAELYIDGSPMRVRLKPSARRAMLAGRLGVLITLSIGCFAVAQGQETSATSPLVDTVERQLEIGSHERLLARIAGHGAPSTEFTSDGCSGGLSAGRERITAQFPDFAVRHGDVPPWQDCCLAHDRRYHRGGGDSESAEQSFEQRKAADLDLAACVVEAGIDRSDALREIYGLTDDQVTGLYRSIAELMYRAVRLGGIPCTTQPWRWGYGWPLCR